MAVREVERTDFQAPFALSMIVCNAIHLDPSTGKAFILGRFESIAATAFPAIHPEMAVFAEVTGCRSLTDSGGPLRGSRCAGKGRIPGRRTAGPIRSRDARGRAGGEKTKRPRFPPYTY